MGRLEKLRTTISARSGSVSYLDKPRRDELEQEIPKWRLAFKPRVLLMVILVSMGGFSFGYDIGSISGFLKMPDYQHRFGDLSLEEHHGRRILSNSRAGMTVAIVSIGTMFGALCSAPIADKFGRRCSIGVWALTLIVGMVIQISASSWVSVVVGRLIAGLGIGALSVVTPMYMAETSPKNIRGALISCFQLFITFGILTAYIINFATSQIEFSSASWRITMGIGFAWPLIMLVGCLFIRESPRWDYRRGSRADAQTTIALINGLEESDLRVAMEMNDIQRNLDAEHAEGTDRHWYEMFTKPRMLYRILLGVALQALQQFTGANFFFYYGTSIFSSVGIPNSFITSIVLGAVNFGATFPALYIVERLGRRVALISGALWMFACLIIFASLGHFLLDHHDPQKTAGIGYAMIVFTCLFIIGFATTWGPIVWTLTGEIYPNQYRAKCMGIATAANWTANFFISFFSPAITAAIGYLFGYVFAGGCFAGAVVVYLFALESQGRSLEEIDEMYLEKVTPWKSSAWKPALHGTRRDTAVTVVEGEEDPRMFS